jgi:polysaccharide pyruvyl transferase WcaK-like protein
MRIGLLTTLETNIGDDFIREGLMHIITHLNSGRSCEYVAVNKHEPHTVYPAWHPIKFCNENKFRPSRMREPLRIRAERYLPPLGLSRFDTCDIILQCGTPVIWEGCRHSEWAKPIWRDVMARLSRKGKPVLNLGGGSSYPCERQPETLVGNPDEEFIGIMLKTACVTTVRDKLAKKLFASLGYEAQHLCCPAMLAGRVFAKPAEPTRKVLINYMSGGGHYDYGQRVDEKVLEMTMSHLVRELRRQGWEPVFIAHNETELRLATQIWQDVPSVLPTDPRDYFEIVRDAAFGIFNRLHASVAAAGLGVPSIAVGTDSRNLMVETLGQPAFYVKEATVDRILAALKTLVSQRDSESRRLLILRENSFELYKDILRPFFKS